MAKPTWLFAIVAAFVATGCQTQTQTLNDEQSVAENAALRRGRFELACPQAEASVLSREVLQPVLYNGLEHTEYTIGVSGCGKRAVYISVCQVNSTSCLAARGRGSGTQSP